MKITFLGAAQNVTGSRFLLETGRDRVLIDCGLFQEWKLRSRNWEPFAVNPARIQAVLLTHAHIDHCGYLPKLVNGGFNGKIFCTPPTAAMTKISLLDAAHLQEMDASYKRKRHKKEGRQGPHPVQPLYNADDVRQTFSRFRNVRYGEPIAVTKNIRACFYEAGHILGAAMIGLEVSEGPSVKDIVFSGDIGRWNRPLLKDPHIFERADIVVMEATYGSRLHEDGSGCLDKLERVIKETHQRGGKIVIPSFAIGRTQELLYDLNILLKENRIPRIAVFVDSPMAIEITEVFERYEEQYFDAEARERLKRYRELFDFPLLRFTATAQESKAINHFDGPAVIIAGSGMCTGGRIKHHLVQQISRPESTVLFVGYQAAGTLGRHILERPGEVRIFGQTHPVRAKIEKINGFSAHADQDELFRWISGMKTAPRRIFIVHAEPEAAQAFAARLKDHSQSEVVIPGYLDEAVLE